MKTLLLSSTLLALLSTFVVGQAQELQLQWIKQIGGLGADEGHSVVTDASGNIYTIAIFSGTVDFDPGAGVVNLQAAAATGLAVSKSDGNGNLLWAKGISGSAYFSKPSIAVDSTGNIYYTGCFVGAADFDPGKDSLELQVKSDGQSEYFISKLDPQGELVWAKKTGLRTFYRDRGNALTADKYGNTYITCNFWGATEMDTTGGKKKLLADDGTECAILKYDSFGNLAWARQFESNGTPALCAGKAIAVDGSGNVYTTGVFNGTTDFDPGAKTYMRTSSTSGGTNIYISKLDGAGNFKWAQKIGESNADLGNSILTDVSGNVYITGSFRGVCDFDAGPDSVKLSSKGSSTYSSDIFVMKVDSTGKLQWARSMGGTGDDHGTSLATDAQGNVYTAGTFTGIADFDPSAAIRPLTSENSVGVFISKFDAFGNWKWATQVGSTMAPSIAVDALGAITVVGTVNGIGDFDPGTGVHYLSSEGVSDVFIAKIKEVPVDVHEPNANIELSISPNPSNSAISLDFGKEVSNASMKLLTLVGQTVLEHNAIYGSSILLDIEVLTAGVYVLVITENGVNTAVKVVKY
ncbi:MAG: SBBP repeat-containing protein [Candidatus Kapaibacterium sp.]